MILQAPPKQFANKSGFIVLDGVNGAGKSTLQNSIIDFLTKNGLAVLKTHEPGATTLGKGIRSLVLGQNDEKLSSLAELFLFAADRAEHVAKTIKPALREGNLVISDRYYYSTTAFQGYGRGLNLDIIDNINKIAIDNLLPDLVILLDLAPEIGLQRTKARGRLNPNKTSVSESDSFENEELEFHRRLRNGFLEIAKISKEPFIIIDATQSAETVFNESLKYIEVWAKS